MLTQNAKISLGAAYARYLYDETYIYEIDNYYKNTNGEQVTQPWDLSGRIWNKSVLKVGTGTTPATDLDYQLENICTDLYYSNTTTYTNYKYSDNLDYLTMKTVVVTNNTSNSYVITELGLLGYCYSGHLASWILLARENIEPVTLNPGDIATFAIYIK